MRATPAVSMRNPRIDPRRASIVTSRAAAWAGILAFATIAVAQEKPRLTSFDSEPQPVAPFETFGIGDEDVPAADVKAAALPPSIRWGLALGDAVEEYAFDAVDQDLLDQLYLEDAARAESDKVLRYGFRREAGADPTTTGEWIDIVGAGRLWVLDVVVPGAIGARLHFAEMDLPADAELSIYAPETPERLWVYDGRGHDKSGDVWVPTVFGERIRVEYFIADAKHDAGATLRDAFDPNARPGFIIDALQHVYRDPLVVTPDTVGNCHNDVTCFPAWANTARASAGIGTINSDALFCSGTMLSTSNSDLTPYWLTANHCISSAATATNSEIYWLYQSSTCNGSVPSLASVPQSAVCTRLAFSSTSDYSLLMVEGSIPSGLYWAGWSSAAVANGTNVTCIHHPDGSFKRISFATKTSGAAANFIRADWYDAPTEPGSSGSGLFLDSTQQLVGQLYGGPSACGNESYDDYGAFATSYGSISSLLAAGSDDAQEPNDSCAAPRAVTTGTYSGLVVKRYAGGDEDWYSLSIAGGASQAISLAFTHAQGDIDMQLYNACGGSVVASSTTTGNGESINYTNSGATATFYLRVYLANDTRATYSMTIGSGGGGGSNNTCSGATTVTNGTYTGSTASATQDGTTSCGSSNTTRDVWYKYTAPRNGTLRVNTCNSSYDTVLSLHSACPGTSANTLRCNDDCGGNPCGGTNSCISRNVSGGVTYYIRVSGYNGANGSFSMTVAGP